MIWHIFMKDFRLLLPLAAVAALLQVVSAALAIRMGPFLEPAELRMLSDLMPLVALLALSALIAAVIHQDAIPGTSQDWLTRPIRRRDLLLAKLLFILLVGHGPLFVANLAEGLGDGFSLPASAAAAFSNGISKFLLLSLPVAALAAVTRRLTELIAAAAGLLLACTVPMILIRQFGVATPETYGTGVAWIEQILIAALLALAAGIILARQYFRRATTSSRAMTLGAAAMVTLVWTGMPWAASFQIQRAFEPERGAANAITLHYESGTGGVREIPPPHIAYGPSTARSASLFVPLRITGIPADSILLMDRADVRVTAANGATRYRGASGYRGASSFVDPSAMQFGDPRVSAGIAQTPVQGRELRISDPVFIPEEIYAAVRSESMQIEIEYSFTLLGVNAMSVLPAVGGTASMPGPITCSTRIETIRTAAQIGCLTPKTPPSCLDAYLEHVPSGARNPVLQQCNPDYAPYSVTLAPQLMNRIGSGVPYQGFGPTQYPLAGRNLSELQLVIRTYTPRDHFTRRLVIPATRLAGWVDGARSYGLIALATTAGIGISK